MEEFEEAGIYQECFLWGRGVGEVRIAPVAYLKVSEVFPCFPGTTRILQQSRRRVHGKVENGFFFPETLGCEGEGVGWISQRGKLPTGETIMECLRAIEHLSADTLFP